MNKNAKNFVLAGLATVGCLVCGCKSPTGSTAPGSFDVLQDSQVKRAASGFYKNRETGEPFTGKVPVYYNPGKLALDMTYVNGRLHSVLCYRSNGSLDSTVSVGSGVLTRYHGDGEIWERRYYKRGKYIKREEYLEGKIVKTEEVNWGNPIPNDGMDALMEKCANAKHAVFNKKNAKLLGSVILTGALLYGLSQVELDTSPSYQTPPPGHYRNSSGQITPINPNITYR